MACGAMDVQRQCPASTSRTSWRARVSPLASKAQPRASARSRKRSSWTYAGTDSAASLFYSAISSIYLEKRVRKKLPTLAYNVASLRAQDASKKNPHESTPWLFRQFKGERLEHSGDGCRHT